MNNLSKNFCKLYVYYYTDPGPTKIEQAIRKHVKEDYVPYLFSYINTNFEVISGERWSFRHEVVKEFSEWTKN